MNGDTLGMGGLSPGYIALETRLKFLEKPLSGVKGEGSEGELRKLKEAAVEFESLFIYYILERLRATVPKSGFPGNSRQEELYTSMLDQELSRHLSMRGGIGLSRMILEQFSRNTGKNLYETP